MKYYIIAGEASGDLHGSNLVSALHKKDLQGEIRAWGGDKMENAGAFIIKHYRDLAFMGFIEVIANISTILKNLSFCKEDILKFKPDVIVLIDYPGFNIRIAQWAKKKGYKVVYYISPQVWAWKEKRVEILKRVVDKMIVILPFEESFYKDSWGWKVDYVGHPLVEVITEFKKTNAHLSVNQKQIAVLPGSRKQEIIKKLPLMLKAAANFPGYTFIVAKAPGLPEDFYQNFLAGYKDVKYEENKTYEILATSKAALVTSGTATLETALFGVPQVICYKGNPLSYIIAKKLVKIKFIGLVNLIMDKEVVKELIQNELTVSNITRELDLLLNNKAKQDSISKDYTALKMLLGKNEPASGKAAAIIINVAKDLPKKLNNQDNDPSNE